MRKILLYTLTTLAAAGMASCEDFLTRDTYDQIGSDEFWKSETDLELYANGFIQKMIPGDGTITRGDIYADYCAVDIPTDLLRPDGNVSPDNQTGWAESNWTNLRRVNYMLDNMHKCRGRVSDEIYNHYEGVARFWRAWFYYDKVQTFGAVPWYDFTIAASDKEAMMKPRDSREYVMDKVLEDLTFASTYSPLRRQVQPKARRSSTSGWRWPSSRASASMKAPSASTTRASRRPNKPWQAEYNADNKFLREAAAAAKEIMDKGPYSLVTGDVKTAYRSLFTSAGLLTQEVIFGREYSKELSAFHETSWYYYSPTYGAKIAMTKKFMNTYLTTRGTPFTDIDGYQTIDFIREFDGRDARMAQTVISPTYKMKISGRERLYSPNWKVTRTGYHPIKWSIDDDADNVLSKAASWNSLPILRYAEVLLNYAEAKAELGEFSDDIWNKTIKPLRERAGVDGKRPTSADPYLQQYYGLSDSDLLEIRRERAIELLLEGFRYDDLMRWHAGELLNKQWYGIYIPAMDTSYDLNGDGINDVCVISGEAGNEPGVTYIVLDDSKYSLENGTTGRLLYTVGRNFEEKRYLRPIPKTALNINPDLGQNYYWR